MQCIYWVNMRFFWDPKGNRQPVFGDEIEAIANRLVNGYQDHGFVIDSDEAAYIFRYHDTYIDNHPETPRSLVRVYTPEYFLGNNIHKVMNFVRFHADNFGYNFWVTGAIARGGEGRFPWFNFMRRR